MGADPLSTFDLRCCRYWARYSDNTVRNIYIVSKVVFRVNQPRAVSPHTTGFHSISQFSFETWEVLELTIGVSPIVHTCMIFLRAALIEP